MSDSIISGSADVIVSKGNESKRNLDKIKW
jgi:hypothetical protein